MSEKVAHSLKARLDEAMASGAEFAVSSADAPASAAAEAPIAEPVIGDVKARVPEVANGDALLNAGDEIVGKRVADSMADADPKALIPDGFLEEEVVLTQEDRDAFLAAVISGKRFEQPFSLYGGALSGVFRSRSTLESEGIAAWLNQGLREGRYGAVLDYAIAIRNSLLAAQVKVLNGTDYTELDKPYAQTMVSGKPTPPGWLPQAEAMAQLPEPVLSALYEELKVFERKYWTMVSHARDQNFWHPVEST